MDSRFDALLRVASESRRSVLSVALAAAAGWLGLGGGLAKKKKKTLCFNGQTIQVKKKKKKRYLRQGATLGACPTPPPPPPDGCGVDGDPCATNDSCCEGFVCGERTPCHATPHCCRELGGFCTHDCDCCGSSGCDTDSNTCVCFGRICPTEGCVLGDECCTDDECDGPAVCNDGFCVCTGEGLACGETCCTLEEETCQEEFQGADTCIDGLCPVAVNFCDSLTLYTCAEGCACMTSVNDQTECIAFANLAEFDCSDCTSDAACGQGEICIPWASLRCANSPCSGSITSTCVPVSCPSLDA